MEKQMIEQELAKARAEYIRLLELERNADPRYVDSIIYRIKAQEAMVNALRKELEERVS